MTWYLMFDALILGEFKQDENGVTKFYKDSRVNDVWLPIFLQLSTDIDVWRRLNLWLKDRVFPENRIGIKGILKELGLKRYDYFEIARLSRASLMSDPFWIAMEESDTWRKKSIRGMANSSNFPANSLSLENVEDYRWKE